MPELAGTWVLNSVLYAPENAFDEDIQFTAKSASGVTRSCSRLYTGLIGGKNYLQYVAREGSGQFYNFTGGNWVDKYETWIFSTGETASPEFLKWLASNATKQ